jgi:hypothetical protein
MNTISTDLTAEPGARDEAWRPPPRRRRGAGSLGRRQATALRCGHLGRRFAAPPPRRPRPAPPAGGKRGAAGAAQRGRRPACAAGGPKGGRAPLAGPEPVAPPPTRGNGRGGAGGRPSQTRAVRNQAWAARPGRPRLPERPAPPSNRSHQAPASSGVPPAIADERRRRSASAGRRPCSSLHALPGRLAGTSRRRCGHRR